MRIVSSLRCALPFCVIAATLTASPPLANAVNLSDVITAAVLLDDNTAEKLVGELGSSQIEQEKGIYDAPELSARVSNAFARLKTRNKEAEKYSVKILNDYNINAYAVPGGHVYVNRGLLEIPGITDAEIAAVLGHEMTHVQKRHGLKQLRQQLAIGFVAGKLSDKGKGAVLVALAGQLYTSGRSRDNEKEADVLGVQWAADAGYDPQGALTFMRRLETMKEQEQRSGRNSPLIGYLEQRLRTHPPTSERCEYLKDRLFERQFGTSYRNLATPIGRAAAASASAFDVPVAETFAKPTEVFERTGFGFGDQWKVAGGKCRCGVWKRHCGVDTDGGRDNEPVVAAAVGKVHYKAGFWGDWGECVVLEHVVPNTGTVTTLYGHIIPSVTDGQTVKQGDTIGTIDPRFSHLHFGIRIGSYDLGLSTKGALAGCGNAGCGPQFPEHFVNPFTFLSEHSQPSASTSPRQDKVLVEPGPQHLGDDTADSKTIWYKEFGLTAADLANRTAAAFKFRVKGTPRKDPIVSINREQVGNAVTNSGQWEWFEFPVPLKTLRAGKNLIDIETVIANLHATFDDCEFADCYLILK